jgi:hypothetical protein
MNPHHYNERRDHSGLSTTLMLINLIGGLVLLYWEARE